MNPIGPVDLPVAETGMAKPPFKASDGGLFTILWSWKDFTLSDLRFHKRMGLLLRQKVRPEAFLIGSPMPVE
jgi:hypothetical protein